MSAPPDVHVHPDRARRRWTVEQGGRTLSRHLLQTTAVRAARGIARREHVELVIHGRDGRVRQKDSEGRESPAPDSPR